MGGRSVRHVVASVLLLLVLGLCLCPIALVSGLSILDEYGTFTDYDATTRERLPAFVVPTVEGDS